MSKETTVILFGLLVIVIPFLGIPHDWRTGLLVVSGVALIVLGFILRTEALANTTEAGYGHADGFSSPSLSALNTHERESVGREIE